MNPFRIAFIAIVAVANFACASASSDDESPSAPIACTLSPEELSRRRQQLLPGLFERAAKVTDLENGLRLTFETREGLLAELVNIVEQERMCCSFLRFQLTVDPSNGPIIFEVTGPPGTHEMLRAL